MQKRVRTIPATISRYTATPINSKKKLRVAGYARVSTDHADQVTSYEAQVDYYTQYIKGRDDWQFAGIYTDEGISATNTKHREGFKQMIEDALAGKIDLIMTKSVSRFARNTVDSLTTVRRLKENGIEVYFEKENIWTLDAKGELLITIMSSLAQEESRSISENVTWGHRKRFADGKVSVPFSRFLGYDRGTDGNLVVNPKQAKTVQLIYQLFVEGYTFHSIARELTRMGHKTPGGKTKWVPETVKSILTNEKYKGDALLQKQYTVDFLTKETRTNHGEVPQYYVEQNHEAIISPKLFDWVQMEIKNRKERKGRYSGVSIYSSKIKCGHCGGWYGAKVWHSTDKYRRTIYRCNDKFKNHCDTPHLTEEEIQEIFIKALNKLVESKAEVICNIQMLQHATGDVMKLREEQERANREMNDAFERVQACIEENAHVALDQKAYEKRYSRLSKEFEDAKNRYDGITEQIEKRQARNEQLERFVQRLREQNMVKGFDKELWCSLVDFITVYSKNDIRVTFQDGTGIKA